MAAASSACHLVDLSCACAATRRAARALTQVYDAHLRGCGIEAAQFALLSAIDGMAPVSQAGLGRALQIDKTTLSRNIRVLVDAGWIKPAASTGSARRDWTLTAAGRRILAKARPEWRAAQAAIQSRIPPRRWREVHATLRLLTEAAIDAVG